MIDQKVVDYIKASLAQGKTKEQLYMEFLGQGRTVEVIQEHFSALNAEEGKEDISKKTIRIIVLIGAILISAGIFSFIAANWQEMPKAIKIGIILIAMLVSYGAGWYLKEKRNLFKTGASLFLLGSIIYGAGIFLVAQMFHMRANWPDGFILWMFGVLAIALALDSFPHFYLAVLLGFIAMVGHPIEIFTETFGSRAFLLTSSFLLLVVTIITFITGWMIRKKIPPELKDFY